MMHPKLGCVISFRRVESEIDFERLYEWQHYDHVKPYWNLAISREAYRQHLEAFLLDTHQTLYIGSIDGVPMSYWECYWAVDDVIAGCYEPKVADQGVHLLIGPPEYIGRGYALPMLEAMVSFLFLHKETDRIVAEPDIRNDKMIHIFKRCGFEVQKTITLPDKQALLLFCNRENFRGSGNDND
ncbi:acetyltransferase [Paenibacillus sp. GSMTC-2017]|uniref:GNAT family N-acetyltransferase n=1 Tax=Paenibacillus sp. GSMTC-2017 TaxID=2794350 RepID=UPI0018D652B6|nr:GNAT family N-acetyltransferase [Paenibacillus sp. GSMTC-2017]MBH5320103.1 acetyltransferase [Paenibacillus sp. GSMTC-2017]